MTCWHTFCGTSWHLYLFAASLDWFSEFSMSFGVTQSNYLFWFWFYDTQMNTAQAQNITTTNKTCNWLNATFDSLYMWWSIFFWTDFFLLVGRRDIWLQWTGKIRNWAVKFMYRRQSETLGTGYMFLVRLCGLGVSLILVSIVMSISCMVVQNINQLFKGIPSQQVIIHIHLFPSFNKTDALSNL